MANEIHAILVEYRILLRKIRKLFVLNLQSIVYCIDIVFYSFL
jgi:hypothetical protein